MIALSIRDHLSFINDEKNHQDSKNIIMSIGIFGTFVGILLGLLDFDTHNIEASVPVLLDGLKTAFITSLFGIGLNVILSVLQHKKETEENAKNQKIVIESLAEMNENLKKQHSEIIQNNNDFKNSLSSNLENLSENIANGNKNISDQIQNLSSNISEQNRTINFNFENLSKAVSDALIQNSREISNKLDVIGGFSTYLRHLEKLNSLDSNVSELVQMIFKQAITFKFNENSEYWLNIFNQLSEIAEELENYKKRVEKLEAELQEKSDELENYKNSATDDKSELVKKVENLQNELRELKAEQEKLLAEKERKLAELEEKLKNCESAPKPVLTGEISEDQERPIEFEDNILAWKDTETGLMWEVKNRENVEHKYVWSKENIETAKYPERLTDDVKDAFSYAEKLNNQNYAGFNDWRVPSLEELKTILTKEKSQFKNFEDDNLYIKDPLAKTTNLWYWTKDTVDNDSSNSWLLNFNIGLDDYNYQSYDYFVRCVR
jgi:GTPase involved in cell partitioning and DNA repair